MTQKLMLPTHLSLSLSLSLYLLFSLRSGEKKRERWLVSIVLKPLIYRSYGEIKRPGFRGFVLMRLNFNYQKVENYSQLSLCLCL